jgi:hypothetical protein
MYKVFIENKVVEFVHSENANENQGESWISSTENLRIQDVLDFLEQYDLLIGTVVYDGEFERILSQIFSEYDWVEAAGGIVKKDKRYLFIERHGRWDIPKGKLEKGEKPEVGAVREVEEECGITAPKINRLLTVTYHTYAYEGNPTIKKTYWYAMDYSGSDQLTPQLDESITQAVWLLKNEWTMVRSNTFSAILDVLDAAQDW